MYISFSRYQKYLECEFAYYHEHILKTKPETPPDRVGMLFGSVIGEVFEAFYRDKVWQTPGVEENLRQMAKPLLIGIMKRELEKGGSFDWKKSASYKSYKSPQEVLDDVLLAIPRGLQIIREHRLLGKDAAAEVKLNQVFGTHELAGRADFIMTRTSPHNDLVILDGKGSKHREEYADEKQLQWYALLYAKKHNRLVQGAAFVYWKPVIPNLEVPNPAPDVDWRPITKESILQLRDEVFTTLSQIEAKRRLPQALEAKAFEPKPKQSTCKFCPYVFACPSGKALMAKGKPDMTEFEDGADVSM